MIAKRIAEIVCFCAIPIIAALPIAGVAPTPAAASTKGCVLQFADGSQECRVQRLGAICEAPNARRGEQRWIDGKRVVGAYQIRRCPGYDGLGRRTGGGSQRRPMTLDQFKDSLRR